MGTGGVTEFSIYQGGFASYNTNPAIGNKLRKNSQWCNVGFFDEYFRLSSASALTEAVVNYKCLFCSFDNTSNGVLTQHRLLWNSKQCVIVCGENSQVVDLKAHRCVDCVTYKCFYDTEQYPVMYLDTYAV